MKILRLLFAFIGCLMVLSSCSDSEEEIPDIEEIEFKYYLKIEVEEKEYVFGFDEIEGSYNPREVYNGAITSNIIGYDSGILFASAIENCDIGNTRDCLEVVMDFSGYDGAAHNIRVKNIQYSTWDNEEAKDGYMTGSISKFNAIEHYAEGSISGRMYNTNILVESKLLPVKGSFRAYYNPNRN